MEIHFKKDNLFTNQLYSFFVSERWHEPDEKGEKEKFENPKLEI